MAFDLRRFHELTQGLGKTTPISPTVPQAAPADIGSILAGGSIDEGMTASAGMSAALPAEPAEPGGWDFGAALKKMFGDPQNVGILGSGALHLMGQPDRAKALLGLTQSHGAGKALKGTLGGEDELTTGDKEGKTSVTEKMTPQGRVRVTTETLPRESSLGGKIRHVMENPWGP